MEPMHPFSKTDPVIKTETSVKGDSVIPASSGLDAGLAHVDGAKRTDIPRELYPRLQNCVATVDLDTKLNLREIVQSVHNAEYNPKRFSAAIIRLRDPKTTALIFASGKMVHFPSRSWYPRSLTAHARYCKQIKKVGYQRAKVTSFKIHNMIFTKALQVGSCGVDFPIRLEPLQEEMKHLGSEYDLEVFPGLILKMQNPPVTLLIFVSGKIVLTGASNWEHMVDAFERIYPTLLKYRKD